MKTIRALTIAISVLLPVAALASPGGTPPCCLDGHCCHGCPFCPGMHR